MLPDTCLAVWVGWAISRTVFVEGVHTEKLSLVALSQGLEGVVGEIRRCSLSFLRQAQELALSEVEGTVHEGGLSTCHSFGRLRTVPEAQPKNLA